MARKVRFENLTVEDVKSKLDKFDDPLIDFPLLKLIRFSSSTRFRRKIIT